MTMSITRLSADDAPAFARCRHIRREVFCVEQGVPESIEWDAYDATCTHYLLEVDGTAAGTSRTRLYTPGVWKIERVAVLKAYRGRGLGRELMLAMIDQARSSAAHQIVLNAQTAVASFYAGLGFVAEGETFVEADIPHIKMRLMLA